MLLCCMTGKYNRLHRILVILPWCVIFNTFFTAKMCLQQVTYCIPVVFFQVSVNGHPLYVISLDTLLYVTQFHGYPQLVSVDKVLQRLDDKDEDSDDVMDI